MNSPDHRAFKREGTHGDGDNPDRIDHSLYRKSILETELSEVHEKIMTYLRKTVCYMVIFAIDMNGKDCAKGESVNLL